jgi:hypothetical protein
VRTYFRSGANELRAMRSGSESMTSSFTKVRHRYLGGWWVMWDV